MGKLGYVIYAAMLLGIACDAGKAVWHLRQNGKRRETIELKQNPMTKVWS